MSLLRQALSRGRRRRGVATADGEPGPDLIVTGVSRSGTSYLCNLLHRFDNCVAVNEPREIIDLLRQEEVPWGVPAFYATLRRDIGANRPIENKLHRGRVVEDTARFDHRSPYRPRVSGANFVLAVKNTREFLLRLDAVRGVMPHARIVVCVRNPVDAIASWKRSFRHLHDADVSPFVEHEHCMWLPDGQRDALRAIAATTQSAERRALWWRFLAERVVEHADDVLLVRYEELVADPVLVLGRILDGYRPGSLRSAVKPSAARSSRALLDGDDLRAITEICSSTAARLDLPLPVG